LQDQGSLPSPEREHPRLPHEKVQHQHREHQQIAPQGHPTDDMAIKQQPAAAWDLQAAHQRRGYSQAEDEEEADGQTPGKPVQREPKR